MYVKKKFNVQFSKILRYEHMMKDTKDSELYSKFLQLQHVPPQFISNFWPEDTEVLITKSHLII